MAEGNASRRFEIITAIGAIFISAVSLAVAIDNERVQRQLVSASTWPFIASQRSNAYGAENDLMIGVTNAGVGPAKIKFIELRYLGHPVGSPGELLRACCGLPLGDAGVEAKLPHGVGESLVDETVLRPDTTTTLLVLRRKTSDPELLSRFNAALLKISFTGCYCSALDDCWMGSLDTTEVKPITVCPKPEHPYRYNKFD